LSRSLPLTGQRVVHRIITDLAVLDVIDLGLRLVECAQAEELFATFPYNRVENRPYQVFFAQGEWTCSIASFTGTMTGPMEGPNGQDIPPTGRSFAVDFCTVAHWVDGKIVEENLFYDSVGLMGHVGLS
jgi:hypothetical protein